MTPEGEIKLAIADYLAILRRRGLLDFWYTYSTGVWDPIRRIMRKRVSKYDRLGIPDITIILKGGRSCFIEVKARGGVQSEYQKEFQEAAEFWGAVYILAHSVADVRQALRSRVGIDI